MIPKKTILMLLAGLVILASGAAGYQSSQRPKGPLDGEYSRSGFLLTLEQGRFSIDGDPGEGLCEQGSYSLDGDKITFNTKNFSASCESVCGKHPAYTYLWSFDADAGQLTFKSIDDLCSFRRGDFTGSPLAYSKLAK